MKLFLTHTFCILAGFFAAGFIFLFFSSMSSLVWQDSIKINASYSLQVEGAKANKRGDFILAENMFQASDIIQSSVKPKTWDMTFPIYGWKKIGLVRYPDTTFSLPDLSVKAYLLEKQGRINDANVVYANLLKTNPSKNKEYFRSIAIQILSEFENG
jgi:hypothetical protein